MGRTYYKGFTIIKTYRHGYNYYKIDGEDAKRIIDLRLENKEEN